MNKFKGGPIQLNSGGMGPDDYMIKPIKGGRWTMVIFRYGRHFVSLDCVDKDMLAMQKLFPLQRIHTSENTRRWQKMKDEGKLVTMNATDFLKKYSQEVV